MTDRERAVAFLREIYRHCADRVETYAWGELVVTPSLPRVYDANFALVDRWDGDGVDLHGELDRSQGEHDFGHRKVVSHDESDWPKELYGRLGFDAIGVEHVAGRSAAGDS